MAGSSRRVHPDVVLATNVMIFGIQTSLQGLIFTKMLQLQSNTVFKTTNSFVICITCIKQNCSLSDVTHWFLEPNDDDDETTQTSY